MMAVVIYKSL